MTDQIDSTDSTDSTDEVPASKPSAQLPVLGVGKGMVVSAMIALLVAMGELDRLSCQVLDAGGRAWAFTTLISPGSLFSTEGWTATFPAYAGERNGWLAAYLLLDLVLIGVYGGVVAPWLWKRGHRVVAATVWVLAGVDVLEDLSAFVGAHLTGGAAGLVGRVAGGAATAKLVLLLLVAILLLRALAKPAVRSVIRSWLRGFYTQRFSILAVLPIALLSIPAGSDLLDQLPDVQRRWVANAQGARHAAIAVLVVAVVTLGVLLLGRLRSGEMWRRTDVSVEAEGVAVLRLGLAAPAVIMLGLVVVALRRGGLPWSMPGLEGLRLTLFLAVPLGIIALSALIRHQLQVGQHTNEPTWWRKHFEVRPHRVPSDEEKRATVLAGDIMTAVSVVVAALGLVRAFTAVAALGAVGLEGGSAWAGPALVVGFGMALAGWPLTRWVGARVTDETLVGGVHADRSPWAKLKATLTPSVQVPARLSLRLGVLVVGVLLFFVVGYFPEWFGSVVGVIGTSLLALLAATLVIGGSVVVVQDRKPPEVFWFKGIRLRSLPVTTILVLTIVATTGLGSDVDIHGVRGLETGPGAPLPVSSRPTLAQAMDDWSTATNGCGHAAAVGGTTYRLRPMFLFAAEGGGIRAAYWTAAGLDLLRGAVVPTGRTVDWTARRAENRCARGLFGGGASGGSVGMTVARFAGNGLARDAVAAMAGPDALGAATSGLFVRDTAYAATGLPFFGTPGHDRAAAPDSPTWLDRGALIEHSWEGTSGLNVPFLPADIHSAASAVSGALVLNSTRVADGCRMWVSQIRLSDATPGQTCDFSSTPAGHTLDLFAALGSGAAGTPAATDHCLGAVTAATGTMLSARFPIVTPSGVVGPCAGQLEQQLVDGGYVENSGLATIVDLAPSWLQEVQKRNTAALRSKAAVVDLVVPVVMYFDNGTGGDLVVDPPSPTPELLVPTTTTGRAKSALVDTPALLRESARLIAVSSLFDADDAPPSSLTTQIEQWRPKPVVVVHQSTFPAVTAPLGWVLSQESIDTMDRALAQQAELGDTASAVPSVTANGSLADAIRLVHPDP
ncbi:MAG: hypothetical protein M3Y06_05325 [Actinomycetota bacterium]|nr:hypothetical protein [Actinomycetota bacterium]